MKIIDIHSHIQFPDYVDEVGSVIARMKEKKVGTIVVGTDLKSSRDAVLLAEKYENVYASVGLHPNDVFEEDFDVGEFRKLVDNRKTVAIGECGLDYFRTQKTEENKEKQKEVLEKQIDLAVEFDLPLMIHCREAYDDLIEIFDEQKKKYGTKLRGNIHFFAGSWDIARKFLRLNFTLSFTGVITFTSDYDEVIKNIPLDKIMVETDSPFVSPVPHRGKRNEPVYVEEVIKQIAKLKDIKIEELELVLLDNSKRVFGIQQQSQH
ncbi:MAG TPA: TatD family deoxyribonuclease [Candidatus Yonathbacteria bacterium]|nr:TatD family deoxyribonuclease [Candidatus Yonathbacteria bacterium]